MPFLTIKDYESEREAISDCLSELTKLLGRFEEHIDLKHKDRKHALYLLVGVAISAAYAAFDQYCKGFIIGVNQWARFVMEVHSLKCCISSGDSDTNQKIQGMFPILMF